MDDVSAATLSLLRALNVAAAPRSVSGYVTAHPAYPSLAALVDCLAELGVRASARRTAFDALASVQAPALVHVRNGAESGAFWLINGCTRGFYDCTLPSGERRGVSETELAGRYLGIAISAVAEPGAGERYADRNELGDRLRARLPLAGILLLAVAIAGSVAAAAHAPSGLVAHSLLFAIFGWTGFGLSLSLSFRDLLDGSSLLGKLCPTGKTFNCAAVVGSEGGYIAKVIPLTDAAAAFFLAQLAAGAAAALTGSVGAFFLLWLVSGVFVVPVMIRSVVLQALVIRRWCALCLLVNASLAAQLALAADAAGFDRTTRDWSALTAVDTRSALLIAAVAIGAALAYAVVRPLVTPALAAPHLYRELDAMRNVPDTLAWALARSPALSTDLPGKLVEGDPAAPFEILVVSHPFCVACADAHSTLERLVQAFPRLARGATVFAVSDADPAAASAARCLLAGEIELSDWYAGVNENATRWAGRNDHGARATEHEAALAAQTAFAESASVTGTPAVFVNGQRLPQAFDLRHLRFYLRSKHRRYRPLDALVRQSA
jgi:uncharacterized membrane protein